MRLCADCGGFLSKTGDCRRCITRDERLKRIEIVPNEPLRSRYLEMHACDEKGWNDRLCVHMGSRGFRHYLRGTRGGQGNADTTHLKRRIGVYAYSDGRAKNKTWVRFLPYEEAVELCRALHMAPHEAGV